MGDLLVVNGKLEMLKQCTTVQKVEKYKKIKANLKIKEPADQILTYKDASDDEGELDKLMQQEDDSANESGEGEYDEEI